MEAGVTVKVLELVDRRFHLTLNQPQYSLRIYAGAGQSLCTSPMGMASEFVAMGKVTCLPIICCSVPSVDCTHRNDRDISIFCLAYYVLRAFSSCGPSLDRDPLRPLESYTVI
jgi:hypothetical protein